MPRPTDWVDTIIQLGATAGGQVFTGLLTGLAPVDLRGLTVIRTIITMGVTSRTVAGAWGVHRCDMAVGIASQEAFAAGVLPDPSVNTDKPPRGWMWRTSLVVTQNGAGAPVMTASVAVDIRGARKVENGQLYLVVDNTALQGTSFTFDVTGLIRVLTKLP